MRTIISMFSIVVVIFMSIIVISICLGVAINSSIISRFTALANIIVLVIVSYTIMLRVIVVLSIVIIMDIIILDVLSCIVSTNCSSSSIIYIGILYFID